MMVPGGFAEVLSGETPIKGDIDSIDQAASFSGDVSDDCVSYSAYLLAASSQLSGGQGEAVQKYRSKLDAALQTGATRLKESADSAKQGFVTYSSEVEGIHKRARAVQDSVDRHLGVIRAESSAIEGIAAQIRCRVAMSWDAPPSTAMPTPVLDPARAGGMDALERDAARRAVAVAHEEEWRRAVTSWIGARDGIESDRATWSALLDERRTVENALVSMLRNTPIGHLISVGSGPGGPGPKYTIAHAISGELWGKTIAPGEVAKRHSGLAGLFPGGDGSTAWDAPADPAAVAAWWGTLEEATREQLIREVPWVIGNLPGLPFGARDRANREMVRFYAAHPGQLSAEQLQLMAQVQEVLRREAEDARIHGGGRPPIQVVALDLTGAVPKAAVGYGDSDAATHTTWAVPGMESDAHLALEGWDIASRNLYAAQSGVAGFGGQSSVIAWLGYDTPDLGDSANAGGVLFSKAAQTGAPRFAAELDGNYAARAAGLLGVPAVNVIAHSYGTTTATIALTLVKHPVTTLTLIASAGLDTVRVSSYDVLRVQESAPGQPAIYTTHASQDYLAPSGAGLSGRGQPNPDALGLFGLEQRSPVYGGGLSFSSDGDPARGLLPTNGHSIIGEQEKRDLVGTAASVGHGYLDVDTQSLSSVAQITTGRIGGLLRSGFVRTEAECTATYVVPGGTRTVRQACE
ncbi:alpha/beta hydrolase [Leucobacter ruminantium]|uniref:DUF1023 domain-containing protein n=1 Tax=Leucobacter ruminantium TaxID=1289170 RepID=A0A939RUA8_9MICO|nr:alpha/beta hydrolase [Leucobacter ruminantium]MBO1805505.1 hypothetical protein [Leucobacter ruminantium]